MTAAPTKARVEKLRASRLAKWQKRRDLYLTDAEWERVQEFVRNLRDPLQTKHSEYRMASI